MESKMLLKKVKEEILNSSNKLLILSKFCEQNKFDTIEVEEGVKNMIFEIKDELDKSIGLLMELEKNINTIDEEAEVY